MIHHFMRVCEVLALIERDGWVLVRLRADHRMKGGAYEFCFDCRPLAHRWNECHVPWLRGA
jgi:hypothetical protein